MDKSMRTQLTKDIIQAYMQLGDSLRMAALPTWITADLTFPQLKAIFLLEHHSSLTISELARQLGIGNPAASILVQQLVEAGLAVRMEDPTDRRRTLVELTAKGSGIITSRREQNQMNLGRWLNLLGDEAITNLQSGLTALISVMQNDSVPEGPTTK